MFEFENIQPEKCGIPAGAIQEFEEKLKEHQIRMHGYLMLSGNGILAEKYWKPYRMNTNHRMYSITKSFTALAVGLLVKQGKVSLSDNICAYFPEKLPQNGVHPWCAEMTIEDMLTMRTCHSSTTFKRYGGGDWTESFFRVKPDHVPGTVFSYDTSSSHVLSALVEKLSGETMLDYMRREVLNKLGFSKGAYMIKDPSGVSQGGSGLMCTLRDVARVAWLCNHAGVLEGEELIPKEFMKQATSNQVPTDLQPVLDERCGYGYFFWMPRKKGFVMYGLGGQLAVCFPESDFCLITMADTIGNPTGLQSIYDSFYEKVYPYLELETIEVQSKEKLNTVKNRDNEIYKFYENDMHWKWIEFVWSENKLRFETPEGIAELFFKSVGSQIQKFPGTEYTYECCGEWKAGHFILHCYITDEEQGHVSMDFAWKEQCMSVRITNTGEPFFKYFKGFGSACVK